MNKLTIFLLAAILLAACSPANRTAEPPTTTPEIFNPLPADVRAFEAARADLAQSLGIDPLSVSLVEASPVDWPDSCLGLAGPNEICAQVVTPGFRVRLLANGVEYEYRTNQDATSIRRVSG